MLSEDLQPWLLEINACPGMAPSSIEKARLCAMVIEDTIKGRALFLYQLCVVLFKMNMYL